MENLGVFGKSFQENLCKLMVYDRSFCDQMQEVLDVGYLELKYLQVFTKKLFDYKNEYRTHPTNGTLNSIFNTELQLENEVIQKQINDYFVRIQAFPDVQDKEYVKNKSLDFCKKQVLKNAMMDSVPLLNDCSFEEIERLITKALRLGLDNNFGYDYIKDFEERFKFKARNPVSTGWPKIDKITKGGLGVGELIVVIAPTGAGKSHVLVHLGAQALKQGKNVVHFTLELADTAVAQRYDACLTGYNLDILIDQKEAIYDNIKNIDGQLLVKEYPTKSATTITLKNHLEKVKQTQMEIDMIIVDYGDLLRSTIANRRNTEKRHELESIYEELRGIAQEFNCPVITASQTNRKGLNEEVITMDSISEAFNKCFVADFIISLSRTLKDRSCNIGRLFVAKNRNGPDGIVFSVFMDTGTVTIKVLEQEDVQKIQRKEQEKKSQQDMASARKVYKLMKEKQT
jgi:KaiC/GvpD/RAD55 family RecA-like ATPase